MTMESRILGPIVLDGGAGGGAMDSTVRFAGTPLPVRLEIDHPDRLSESLIDDLDVVLEHLDIPDRFARDAIRAALRSAHSAPAQLFQAWQQSRGRMDSPVDEFVDTLRPTKMTITPDGGKANLDRVVIAYSLSDSSVQGQITVRLPDVATGPEIDPAPRGGFR